MPRPQNILITGATSGIGRAAALDLAAAGHRVFAAGRNQRALDELSATANVSAHRLDVTDESSISALRDEVFEQTDGYGVDVLVNNAGYGLAAPMTEVDQDDLRHQFETNVFGLVAVTRAFVPAMQARRTGTVINVSSTGGRISFPFFGPYTGTKFAVEAMSDALRVELRGFGVRVSVIEPGPIHTGFADTTMAGVNRYRDPSSPYASAYANADAARARADRMAGSVDDVTRVIARIIRSKRPAPRYVVPFSSRLMLLASRFVPTRLLDALLARFLGLTPKQLPSASPSASGSAEPSPSSSYGEAQAS